MAAGFQNKTLDTRTSNGLNDTLLEPLVFIRKNGDLIQAPVGGTTDGLSVPRCIQNIIPATGGDWFSGVLHDSAYRNQLQIFKNDTWVLADYTQKEADDLMLEALIAQEVGMIMRQTIYRALRMFGSFAYKDNRKNPKTS